MPSISTCSRERHEAAELVGASSAAEEMFGEYQLTGPSQNGDRYFRRTDFQGAFQGQAIVLRPRHLLLPKFVLLKLENLVITATICIRHAAYALRSETLDRSLRAQIVFMHGEDDRLYGRERMSQHEPLHLFVPGAAPAAVGKKRPADLHLVMPADDEARRTDDLSVAAVYRQKSAPRMQCFVEPLPEHRPFRSIL